ncbi:gamma-glutamyltransferase [Siccirubricoccus deserti]|uniref:Glutathione hydrolase proenzyme n=1 Tax=Siccirubricoccus deserti TaxID=2013562 RepID=A0A9X0UF06_9PROT|nr:gamma-glutamyltransferase [Siccirubricoccus deserti]MBC4018444.1 gamma-glutamyltransferase [Siccirubricoccus deserti]GGC65761.1 gamma-glutamyltransferase [Siccirubricoccus deserti]
MPRPDSRSRAYSPSRSRADIPWRSRAGSPFTTEKRPATGSRGMVVTNHPLASAAGTEMLAAGGNAVDAAVAALFALTVVEPMMVGLLGGGMMHLRLPDGTHTVLDGLSTVPAAGTPGMFTPVSQAWPAALETVGRANAVGATAVATPGNLLAWCEALRRFGSLPLEAVMQPAIRLAARGFPATPYLAACAAEAAADLAQDAGIAALFLPGGMPLKPGARVVMGAAAETLATIARDGPGALHGGPVGAAVATEVTKRGGILAEADLRDFALLERAPVRGSYRGFEVVGPPPPSSGGVHVIQMLNILEGFDLGALGFGTAESAHLIAEALKIAFADRNAATADPAFVRVPVEQLLSPGYAAELRAAVDPARAQSWTAGVGLPHARPGTAGMGPVAAGESPNTTHLTVADAEGRIVCATHTINSLFGARFLVPEVGLIPNNYMALFDPRPGHALSIAPGKRVTTSQAPLIALRDGRPFAALGLPGGLRIFGSAMQALIGLIDHGMSLQEAVEAPRIWTQGLALEVEQGIATAVREALGAMGHAVQLLPHVAGGMCGIRFHDDGTLEGAACWRADGTPMGVGGGLARSGVRFWPDDPARG